MSRQRKLRLPAIVLAGLLVCSAAYAYVHFTFARPIGEGPAGPEVPAEPFEAVWTERVVELIGIGDSITAGLGAKSLEHSYFRRLLQNPADEYADMVGKCLRRTVPNLSGENLAISGSTSLQHEDVIKQRLNPRDATVFGLVVMTTGGNDIIHSYGRSAPREGAMYGADLEQARPWIAEFEARLARMLDQITLAFPGGCEIYLADIYDPTDGVGDAPSIMLEHWPEGLAVHAEYNRILRQAANERPNVFLVPLYDLFLGHGSHCRQFWRTNYDTHDPHYWFYENVEDPNDRGYDAIRRCFLNTIIEHTELRPSTAI